MKPPTPFLLLLPPLTPVFPTLIDFAVNSLLTPLTSLSSLLPSSHPTLYTPSTDPSPSTRQQEIATNAAGFGYGPSKLGDTSYFPNGTLADRLVAEQWAEWQAENAAFALPVAGEMVVVGAKVRTEGDDLQDLDDFKTLYDGQWPLTVPDGVSPGLLGNYTADDTADATFAMARLSGNPFSLVRLPPDQEPPFRVEEETCRRITGEGFEALWKQGRMFVMEYAFFGEEKYVSHRFPERYLASTTSLFYISGDSNSNATSSNSNTTGERPGRGRSQFLPLAIKTGVGQNLVYTRLDGEYEWLLAKIAANSNDLFFGQIYHLIATHAVAEIVNLAAIRTVSGRHPVRAYLERIMYRAYAVRPVGEQILFNRGGFFDGIFSLSSRAVTTFATTFYHNSTSAHFRGNYLLPELAARGLINSTIGPELPQFPFLEDMAVIHAAIHDFAHALVDEYYTTDDDVRRDNELINWFNECNSPAKVLDFPPAEDLSKTVLVDVLTHMAYLAGPKHAALNMGTPFTTSGVLPLFPAALYRPMPQQKGEVHRANIHEWLPDTTQAVKQVRLLGLFNRPEELLRYQGTRMLDLWSGWEGEGSERGAMRTAAREFRRRLERLDKVIKGRTLSGERRRGRGFVFKTLAPGRFPYYLAI
ncbi:Lipoxygenase [Ascodesmis nigricans]|uniref:Manganese lipoxygenase n=1 Tax=Ascodesmis nigricans TaxID=341454 RepID=A0A4V3SHW9_9PEZI|nr:Lipoxygenase [Ascodesmis nigricans]